MNTSGRNDIVESRVAVDRKNVYFYVKAASDLTSFHDPNWMLLLIDADNDSQTGWYGYDFIINKEVSDDHHTVLMQFDASSASWKPVTQISYAQQGNRMELAVPRKLLRLIQKQFTFDFKWADNPQTLTDPISLCTDGDTAPNRRFNYRFIWNQQ